MKILPKINCHEDLLCLSDGDRIQLCLEIREFLIDSVSRTGGHLAGNLGAVELSVAIETVFDTGKDRLVFDVGHQSYVHKILTGRRESFDGLRQYGGISGFPKPSESNTDSFVAGHASSSVSIALGMAKARTLQGEDYDVVALIGDGAVTGGMAYEGLNNAAVSREPMVVILNDNEMSIGENVGGMSKHLSRIRSSENYLEAKQAYRKVLKQIPGGKALYAFSSRMKNRVKRFLLPTSIFESMGFTYLSDKHPRYDARRVAVSRSRREGAAVVLSSATPSILSFAMARRGDYTLVEMPHRVQNRPMPEVTIVDMRKELDGGNRSIFSRLLIQKLTDCLESGQQAMLFLNRRGYNTFVSCRKCGYVVKCEQCDISMTLHREQGEDGPQELRCHMCGNVSQPPEICPECGSKYIRYFGSGTQRVEEEMHKLFPHVKTVRMDIDTTRERDAHAKLLHQFGSGEAKVLIGTQMIAKGLDFPKVTLVGVVAADMTLNLPDYRAQERTFQLITQVAGRAGRAEQPGEVIVQTYKPEDPCIKAAAAQDYRAFFEMEFARRRAGLYPPFTLLARLLIESPREMDAHMTCEQLYNTLQTYLLSHPKQKKRTLILRSDAAPVKRIRGQFRYHVLLKVFDHPDIAPLLALMSELSAVSNESCRIYCEVNPATMM